MMNFQTITHATTRYNLHTHTQFCDGHATMEEFVRAAIDQGFTHLGFTPHSPVHIDSPCNMARHRLPDYLAELNRLREVYGNQIAIYAGMELDYIDGTEQADPSLTALPLDYRIGSVHFIPSFVNPQEYIDIDGRYEKFKAKMGFFFHNDIEAVVRSFFVQSMKMLDAGGFDVVGHFDKIGFNASLFSPGIDEQPWYDTLVQRLFEAIMDYHYVVEINTKAWQLHNRFFPNRRYFGLLKKNHTPIIINSDAHYPALLDSGRAEALQSLQHASIN
ncbi:MAG: histidinol-phosphatase [Muribaculaceae bacterium]|nr:histidinol-phosphatase [Muribaculaceae bacterium]